MVASFVLSGWAFALISMKRYAGLLVVNAVAFAVSCTLTLTLASAHGAQGAAVAVLCGELTLLVGYLFVLIHGHPEFRPRLKVLPKVALATAPAAAIALALDVSSLARTVIALGVYALLIVLTRATPREITELLPRPARHRVADL
jgi:O-antigen/teichoic acid export membrane protein